MEFFPGAFEREWERRRAMLMHERQLGQREEIDWDEPRRGGAARVTEKDCRGFARTRLDGSHRRQDRGGVGSGNRSMRTRFAALARGSQPAMVKLASYGQGGRVAAMVSYAARDGELAVENERGEHLLGRLALAQQRAEWEHLFDNRTASRDMAVFDVAIDSGSLRSNVDENDQLREILRSGFGDRRFVYKTRERNPDRLCLSGVVVLRDRSGERLTADRKAAEIVQQRYDETATGKEIKARFRFHGYGNGVEWGAARVRELVEGADGKVRDDRGRLTADATHAGDLVQKEWRKELHSRKGRDLMHLIVSARAGTDGVGFKLAVREFLGEQFAGHRYVFAVHDPLLDPKEMALGGKRPHIHAHAIVTTRSETGGRIVTSPQLFREWRSVMADKAREQGIEMELTDRREFANAPAYTRNQVRPVNYLGRTEHAGTSHSAHSRYLAKRGNHLGQAFSDRCRRYALRAARAWDALAREEPGSPESFFAHAQGARLRVGEIAALARHLALGREGELSALNQLVKGDDEMLAMTRRQFAAYERRVEMLLGSIAQSLDRSQRSEFDEIASAAREVVAVRRQHLELTERQGQLVAQKGDEREGRALDYSGQNSKGVVIEAIINRSSQAASHFEHEKVRVFGGPRSEERDSSERHLPRDTSGQPTLSHLQAATTKSNQPRQHAPRVERTDREQRDHVSPNSREDPER